MASTPYQTTGTVQNIVPGPAATLGGATTDTVGFYGSVGVARRTGSAQAAVATTAATTTSPYGFTTAAQADGIVTLVNEIRAALVAVNLIKGSA